MNKRYRLRIDVINMIIRFMVFISITSFILYAVTGLVSNVWKIFILLPAIIISFLIRKYTKNIWSFIILNLVLLAAYIFFTDEIVLRVAYGFNITIFAITEFVLDISKKIKNSSLVLSIIFIAIYALCKRVYPEEKILGLFFFCFAIAFGLLYIVNMYYVNSYIYFKRNEEKANIPIKKIQSSNAFYMGGFLLLSFAVMILFARIPLGGITKVLGSILGKFIKFIISKFNIKLDEPPAGITIEEASSNNLIGVQEPSLLSDITIIVFGVLTIIIITALIIYGLYGIYKVFYSKVVLIDEERVEPITPMNKRVIKRIGDKSSLRRGVLAFFDRSNNVKIRKQYLRAVQKNTPSGKELKYKLPKELSKYALEYNKSHRDELSTQKKLEDLTAIYEKARYSDTECSKEELQSLKDILK